MRAYTEKGEVKFNPIRTLAHSPSNTGVILETAPRKESERSPPELPRGAAAS